MATANNFSKAWNDLTAGASLYQVWFYQAYHELSAKYKRTLLGGLWNTASMVVTALSFAIIYGALFKQDVHVVLPYIMSGIVGFNMISHIFVDAPETYTRAAGIILNNAGPLTYYNFEAISKTFITFLHNIAVYFVAMAIIGASVIPNYTLIFGIIFALFNMFTWGGIIALGATRFKDIRFLLPYMSQLALFLTPIMYKPDQLSPSKQIIVDANPLYPLVQAIRAPLLGETLSGRYVPMLIAVTVLGAVLWMVLFSMFRKKIAFWI